MTARGSRRSWRGWHSDGVGYAPAALVVRCGPARLLTVTREDPPRVVARYKTANQWDRTIDAGGVRWLGMDDKGNRSTDYIPVLDVRCPRHDSVATDENGWVGHLLDPARLVAEWQGVDMRRKGALFIDAARLLVPRPLRL